MNPFRGRNTEFFLKGVNIFHIRADGNTVKPRYFMSPNFVINLPMSFFEKKLFKNGQLSGKAGRVLNKCSRGISLLLAYGNTVKPRYFMSQKATLHARMNRLNHRLPFI